MKHVVFLVLALTGVILGWGGCASTREESDLPWNTPQPWEGVIAPMGFDGQP